MYEHFSVNTNFLGNDFMHPAEANLSTKDKWKKTLKANTCMASKSRYVRSSVYLQEVISTTFLHRVQQLLSFL